MNKTTIIYYTDNSLKPEFEQFCQKKLFEAAQGKRIISVSQKPINFGRNTCVGDIGRSHLSLFKQILVGVEQVKTKYLALAEHDCLYAPEHFNWIPPTDDKFYYNVNHWFLQWNGSGKDGLFSYHRRKVLSNMIASTELTLQAAKDKVEMLEAGALIRKGQPGACEFGVCDDRIAYIDYVASMKDFGKDIGRYRAESFRTRIPNIDIRHGNNFSGHRRSKKCVWSLEGWGTLADITERQYARTA